MTASKEAATAKPAPRGGAVPAGGRAEGAGGRGGAVAARAAGGGTRPKAKVVREPAAEAPYARVVLAAATGVDQVVDYLVPVELDESVRLGIRVRVRWDGELVDGVVVGRAASSEFHDHFEWVQKVVSEVPAFTPEIAELAAVVAEKYAGTPVEVLRLAVPARVASVEKAAGADADAAEDRPMRRVDGAPWGPYGGGREFITALERKSGDRLPRALWTCLPGTDWVTAVATALHAVASDVTYIPEPEVTETPEEETSPAAGTEVPLPPGGVPDDYDPDLYPDIGYDPDFDPELYNFDPDADDVAEGLDPDGNQREAAPAVARAGHGGPGHGGPGHAEPEIEPVHVTGRGTLAIVPDLRELARLDRTLTELAGPGNHVVLSEELGPAKWYQNWLAVLRGEVRMVIGTRAALFAPVADLGFVVMWDDGDERHAEPRPPYPHVREVLLLRAHQTGAGALIGGYTCTAEGAQLVAGRWAFPLTAFRSTVLAKAPRIRAVGADGEAGEERDAGAVAAGLPNLAWRTARGALTSGPVLVQTPGAGLLAGPALVCARCGKHARCGFCHGPLGEITGPQSSVQSSVQSSAQGSGQGAATGLRGEGSGGGAGAGAPGVGGLPSGGPGSGLPSGPGLGGPGLSGPGFGGPGAEPAGSGILHPGSGQPGLRAPGRPAPGGVRCLWCTRPAEWWHCDGSRYDRPCDGDRFRPAASGPPRTADDLGEAFPHLLVVTSTLASPVAEVGPKPALVVAEPGAEPHAEGGYAAALLLDGAALLARPDLRAGAEALRRWLNAAALVRPAEDGGAVVVVADPADAAVHAVETWDPVAFARREADLRGRLHHPPGARVAELVGTPRALAAELDALRLPAGAEVLGPAPVDAAGGEHRVLIRVPRGAGAALTAALREARESRDAKGGRRGEPGVRVRIDPVGIG